MRQTDTEFTRPDGTVLRGWIREPDSPEPWRALWIVHGLGEHIGRHDEFAAWLLQRGWTVAAHDHRGHGRSDGRRGVIRNRDDLVDDLADGLGRFSARLAAPPVLYGDSMGGLIALSLALRGRATLAGLIMSSPALDAGLSALQKILYQALLRLAPDLAVPTGLSPDRLSHDLEVAQRWRTDPLVHERISARLLDFIVAGSERAQRDAGSLAVPTLLQFGSDDSFVAPEGCRRFARAAPSAMLTVHEYPGLWHELQNEPATLRAPVRADLGRWLARFD